MSNELEKTQNALKGALKACDEYRKQVEELEKALEWVIGNIDHACSRCSNVCPLWEFDDCSVIIQANQKMAEWAKQQAKEAD